MRAFFLFHSASTGIFLLQLGHSMGFIADTDLKHIFIPPFTPLVDFDHPQLAPTTSHSSDKQYLLNQKGYLV